VTNRSPGGWGRWRLWYYLTDARSRSPAAADGPVRVWDLTRCVSVGEPLTDHTGPVEAVAAEVLRGPAAEQVDRIRPVRGEVADPSQSDPQPVGVSTWVCLPGHDPFERSGLGAPTGTAALQAELEQHRQANLDLKRVLEERDEELAAARETNRRLLNQLNRPVS
jgi:hypothetical protein